MEKTSSTPTCTSTQSPAGTPTASASSETKTRKPPRSDRPDRSEMWLAIILLAPNLVLLAIFTYRPLIDNFRLSFTNWNISSDSFDWIGFNNYVEWFRSPTTWQIVSNTVIFTLAAVLGSLALGLFLALILDQKLRGRGFVRSVVFAPYIISGAAIGIAFQFVFDPAVGLISDIMVRLGYTAPDFYQRPGWALLMITTTYIWKNLGYTFVIYLAALQGRRTDLDEAAEIDGTPGWRRFTKVLLPQLRPTTFFLSITVLLNSMQVFDIINVMTRGGPQGTGTTTMVYQVYQETFVNARAGYGATVASILFLILLVITLIQVRFMQKGERP
ncbi:sugar ABC transporter permease [Gleimia hominis]|uniref:Sugar ABC transporter permease n=1 Tax=Gleimia hominis TaxID=595468 RepID=A0ABU3IDG4_9ACTO|nr:sugar ABC transporter permease [Gleimia hominis]MDT3768006.1 sugar ABC transporter permease [Gleimia hominis]